MSARKHGAIAPDEVIVAILIQDISGQHITGQNGIGIRGDKAACGVFLLGACLQTDPQLEEVGVCHGAPLRSSRLNPVGPLAPPQKDIRSWDRSRSSESASRGVA